jgi:formylmethanofuran dehydrogenase subunit E
MDLERAKEFHGHLGPFLVLGLRMGERAIALLGANKYFGLKATVFCPIEPPERCMADGIQLSTGCTFGKGNIELVPSRRLALFLHSGDKGVRVEVREEAIERIKEWLKEGEELAVSNLLQIPDEELFRSI